MLLRAEVRILIIDVIRFSLSSLVSSKTAYVGDDTNDVLRQVPAKVDFISRLFDSRENEIIMNGNKF